MSQFAIRRPYGPRTSLGAAIPHRLRDLEADEFLALGVLFAGLGTAASLFLYAKGYEREAAIAGIGASITGAFVGAAKVLGGSHS